MSQKNYPDKIGLIAGEGELPFILLQAFQRLGVEAFIIGFEGHTNPDLMVGHQHLWGKLGRIGQMIDALKSHDISDLVLIGGIKRPTLTELMPDAKALAFLSQIGSKFFGGDDELLTSVRSLLKAEGFSIHGAHQFAAELLMPKGVLGKVSVHKDFTDDIQRGVQVSQAVGALDVGQAVIVQQGLILGVEAIEGTDELIRRSALLARKGRGAILAKTCKPQQDVNLDMPTLGLETVKQAHQAGLAGIVAQAGRCLLISKEEVVAYCDQHKLFLCGIEV